MKKVKYKIFTEVKLKDGRDGLVINYYYSDLFRDHTYSVKVDDKMVHLREDEIQ